MDGHHGSQDSELKFLERLSIEELETLLRLSGNPADVEMLFDAIVEEVVARENENNTGRLPDVNSAWEELLARYSLEQDQPGFMLTEDAILPDDSEDTYCIERRTPQVSLRRMVRTATTIAATIVLSLALMVGAQATGADVFGALARWTSDTFHFETAYSERSHCDILHDTVEGALSNQGIVGEYSPKWFPDGFNIVSISTEEDVMGTSMRIMFANDSGNLFTVSIDQYNEETYIDPLTFEIESGSVEEYLSNEKLYYIFANAEATTAVYNDSVTIYRIWGELTVSEVKSMIDSIGG